MPDIVTTSLPNAIKNIAYNQAILANKVSAWSLTRSGSISNPGTDTLGDIDTGVGTSFNYTLENTGEDDQDFASNPVSVSGESNCSVNITGQLPTNIEPGSTGDFTLEVTPTADGAFSFSVTFLNVEGEQFDFTVTGNGISVVNYAAIANIHWQGDTDSLINWSAGQATNGQAVQYLANSINTFDAASYIRDPFNNGSGVRVDGAFTGHSGLRINSFGSQYPVRNAANNADVAPTEFLALDLFLLYAAGVHNAAQGGNNIIWGVAGANLAIMVKADGTGVGFRMNSGTTEYRYDVTLNPGDKWTVVAGLQGGLLTVYVNGTLVADEVAVDGPVLSFGTSLRLDYNGLDQTTVLCGAGKITGAKSTVTTVSNDLEARRAA